MEALLNSAALAGIMLWLPASIADYNRGCARTLPSYSSSGGWENFLVASYLVTGSLGSRTSLHSSLVPVVHCRIHSSP